MFKGKTPEKGSKEYNRNEKIINNNPVLKKARDTTEGFNTANKNYGSSHGGKGSSQRPGNKAAYEDGWDRIWGNKNSSQTEE